MVKAQFAGQFYESKEFELDKQIASCFEDKNGPGDLPLSKRTNNVKAIIAPHAGYQFSGPCAAWAYKEIAESEFADVYIIIGPSHANTASAISMSGYETPFGLARTDQEFARMLLEKNNELKTDDELFRDEHSVEVQIPFLQYVSKDKMHELKILPILLGSEIDIAKLALDLKDTIVESGKKAIFIISSDFTHYGRNYHHIPFSTDVKKNIYETDRKAIEFIEHFDVDGWMEYVQDNLMTICGFIPVAVLLKSIKKVPVRLEHYYTSADLDPESDYKNAVSYAAIIFDEEELEE
ncbi:MAG: AmmeMemoRadiSam system protein B [Candidatus Woesearchaeota archaeon]